MSTIPTSVFSANSTEKLDSLVAFPKPTIVLRNPSMASSATWTGMAKPISQTPSFRTHSSSSSSFHTCSFLGIAHEFSPSSRFSGCGLHRIGEVRPSLLNLNNDIGADGVLARGYGSAAEVVPVSSTEGDEDGSVAGEVEELLKAVKRAEKNAEAKRWRVKRVSEMGMQDWKYRRLKRRQIVVETEAWEKAASEYRTLMADMCEQKLAPNLPYIKSLLLGWFEPMRDAVIKEQKLCQRVRHNGHAMHFDELPADMMSLITMHKLMALLMSGGGVIKLAATACSIGEAIEHEIRIQKFLEKTKKKKVDKNKKNVEAGPDSETNEQEKLRTEATNLLKTNEQEKLRKKVTSLLKRQKLRAVREIVKGHDDSQPWPQELKAKVGSRLLELLIETAYVQPPANQIADGPPDIRPAFVHTVKSSLSKDGRTRHFGIIQCDPLILKGLDTTARHMVIPYMPMLIPPVKWTSYDKGAHLFLPSYVMRTHGDRQQREVLTKAPKKQLEPVYKALDILGSTKWRVNKRVLDIVDTVWDNGGRLAGLVDRDNVPLPEGPDTEDEVELQKWKWKLRSGRKENRERYSQRCDIELKLAVARKLKDEEGFYYPHNLDFRGRAYPMHPYLNHLGSDLCRGILEFGEGRPLGESGLRWLKIHLANLYAGGADKLSLEGRIVFTESHLDDIFDSADLPLEGRRWWLNAEDPFQCLAVCITLTEALRSSSPETFVSHVPVHQDGSCNGLQHYAALGRDKVGAAAVNLIAGDKPADVYSDIASRVLHIMQGDAEKDPADFPDASSARILINQVDRKLVKQTVMTSVYGVTYIGARDQIKRRLKERDVIADEQVAYAAACYAAKVTLTALGEMFEGARGIMNWLGECAKVIAHENQAVCWTTPLGLPAVQPYRKLGKNMVKTSLQILTLHQETEKVMVKRQRTAFPPNFVHSLDGSHMMMTALACNEAGLTFAGVHDSYWTHACDVDEMNRILREKFVELYETPVLENVLESFQESFPELTFPPLPERGDFNLRDVLDSPYFFN